MKICCSNNVKSLSAPSFKLHTSLSGILWLDPLFKARKHWNLIYLGILFWVVFWFKNVNLPSTELEITWEAFILIQRSNYLAQLSMFILADLRPFDMKVLQIRPYPAQDAESKRLNEVSRKTEQEHNHVNFWNRIHKQRVSCSVREIPSMRKSCASL